MKLVLLSGGSGIRLWPLSSSIRSKQFLQVLPAPGGGHESMLQRIWRQLSAAGLNHEAYIATSSGQEMLIRKQLGAAPPIIIEPRRRDTFPAVSLAAAFLNSVEKISPEETVIVLPVDAYVSDDFFFKLLELDNALHHSGAEIALLGAKPNDPSEKYGYIVPDTSSVSATRTQANRTYVSVDRFVEKPDRIAAEALLAQQAMWNCGIFAFRLCDLLKRLENSGFPTDYVELQKQYHRLPKSSFDVEVLEGNSRLICVPYLESWKDLGTWNTLSEELASPVLGRGQISADSVNCQIVNELDIPVMLVGLDDVIVAAGPGGILVARKDAADYLKQLLPVPDIESRKESVHSD
ncbi:mannose-1-phosphate guanylyltransferase [Paenibacillus sp. LMG 31459]|uniref:Mannose-1-phosphate guanylyltransferase n=1 Tax=Paenibacillus phytohabitans TaxID=2654978 RepID=A0ABX1YKI4_9BACL|nr:sugar phosphate nucleotidyltransferase [Paenibacillus phytohabitans]NOU81553.1 mannose-1-phosphate guanylyltransferase [Paenibacillus phytohabitans]